MKIIKPYVRVPELDGQQIMKNIERYGRVCYKSEDRITEDSYKTFIAGIIKRGHESILEHEKVTVTFVCDRGVSHELVRHRIASFSQESTRYCNYGGDDIVCIEPFFLLNKKRAYDAWIRACKMAELEYGIMLKLGCSPQEARSVLPNSLKTEVVVTANIREWRHIFKLRCSKAAHPQMQQVMIPLLLWHFQITMPELFSDIDFNPDFPAKQMADVID